MRPKRHLKTMRGKKVTSSKETLLIDAFDEYILVKEADGLRERTLSDHRKHFDYFLRFCKLVKKTPKYVSDVDKSLCRQYVSYMLREKGKWDNHPHLAKVSDRKGLSPSTINIRLRSLKAEFAWYVTEGYIEENPWDSVSLMKVDESPLTSFSREDVVKLLTAPDKSTFVGFRNYVLLKLFLEVGGRVSELLALDELDVDLRTRVITLSSDTTKARKSREIPISASMAELLKRLIRENRTMADREPAVFLSVSGKRLQPSDVRRIMRDYKRKQGIANVRVSPHTCRHTFAKFYISAGGDPFSLQSILGHSTMEMVRRYVKTDVEHIRMQMENVQKKLQVTKRKR